MFKFPNMFIDLFISLFHSVSFSFTYVEAMLVKQIQTLDFYIFLLIWSIYQFMKCPSLEIVLALKSAFSDLVQLF